MSARTVLITGATGVIGQATAHALCDADTTLVLHYRRDREAVGELARLLSPKAREVLLVHADLGDEGAAAGLLDEVADRVGPPNVLVSNAGVLRPGAMQRFDPGEWAESVQVNLNAPALLAAAALPAMTAGGFGRMIFVSSVSALRARPYQAAYSASKAGLLGLVRSTAFECARFGVTVNAVAPGYIDSPMSRQGGGRLRRNILEHTPIGRAGTPEEVAAAIGFLCSAQASFITGQVLAVDGGASM